MKSQIHKNVITAFYSRYSRNCSRSTSSFNMSVNTHEIRWIVYDFCICFLYNQTMGHFDITLSNFYGSLILNIKYSKRNNEISWIISAGK